MTTPDAPTLDLLLRLCSAAAPAPWYPSQYAKATGTDRDALDEPLNRLRLAGLLRLTDWEPGVGQGYAVTDTGRAVLDNPRALARLRAGDVPAATRARAGSAPPDRPTTWDRGEAVRAALYDATGYAPVNRALIALQLLVFIAGVSIVLHRHGSLSAYLADGTWGDKPPTPVLRPLVLTAPDLVRGERWRLLTYFTVHYGVLHLLLNLYGNLSLGPVIEQMFGSVRYLVLYLLAALGGGVFAALLAPPLAATAGSSGALCGMIGGFGAFILVNHQYLGVGALAHSRRWLVNTLILVTMFSLLPGVSWQAHLGGAAVGFVAGVLLNFQRLGTPAQRWAAVLGLLLLPAACLLPLAERGLLRPHRSAREEIGDFEGRLVPAVDRVRKRTADVLAEQVEPLRAVRPGQRDAGQVQAALAALAGLKDEQRAAWQLVAETAPYHTAPLEQLRQLALGYLDGLAKASDLLADCLKRGDRWGGPDEAQLQGLLNQTLEAELLWRQASRLTVNR
jgi:membrane associated rhomboid family serine protease